MQTDLYTKPMLTLIVLFLGLLSFDRVYDVPDESEDRPLQEQDAKLTPKTDGPWNCHFHVFVEHSGPVTATAGWIEMWANKLDWDFMTMVETGDPMAPVLFCGRKARN